MSGSIRLRLIGVLAAVLAAVAVAGRTGAAISALGLTASATHVVVPPGPLSDHAEVTFTLSEPRSLPVNLNVCTNSRVGAEECSDGQYPVRGQFGSGQQTHTVPLEAGRHEVMAVDQFGDASNVVAVVVEDECRWLGVSGAPSTPPVLSGAPFPCTAQLNGAYQLTSASGSRLVHSGQSRMTHGVAELRLAAGGYVRLGPMIYVKLGFEKPYGRPARLRYSLRGEQGRFIFVTSTQSGTVYTRGPAEVEVSHAGILTRPARRPTRVRVIRGAAAYIPVADARGIRVPPGCAARPTIACLAKARHGLRRATLVRAGQTRLLR